MTGEPISGDGQVLLPADLAGGAVDADGAAGVGGVDREVAVDARRARTPRPSPRSGPSATRPAGCPGCAGLSFIIWPICAPVRCAAPIPSRRRACPARRRRRTRRCPRRSRSGTCGSAGARCRRSSRRCPSPGRGRRSSRSTSVLPEMATEFSIDISVSPTSLSSSVVPARRVEHELGRDLHRARRRPVDRFSFTMWSWLFSPPSNR